ncbi:unnamed protein product [Pylaiella littoralis]
MGGSSPGRPPLGHTRNNPQGVERGEVMAELRELKADINELGRSLDGSSISFALRQRDLARSKTPSTATASLASGFYGPVPSVGFSSASPRAPSYFSPCRQNQNSGNYHDHGDYHQNIVVPRTIPRLRSHYPRNARVQQGEPGNQREGPWPSGGGSDYELDVRLPPPPPSRFTRRPGAPVCAAPDAAAAAAAVAEVAVVSDVRADLGGVRDAGQLVRQVEASARAVSLENEDIVKSLRTEEEKTERLRNALWEEGTVKREWELLTEASRALRQRLESTERIRNRQKELIRELQAVEADIAFANAGSKAGRFSPDPLPELWPPSLPPPPQPPSTAQQKKASPPYLPPPHRDHEETNQTERVDKERRGGSGLGVAKQRSQQHQRQRQRQRQRQSKLVASHAAGRVSLGGCARVEMEGGGGGGIEGLCSEGRAAMSEKRRTTACVAARAECRVDGCFTAAAAAAAARRDRRAKSNAARRTRTPTSGNTSAQAHKAKRKQHSGTPRRRGGGYRSGCDDLGRTLHTSTSGSFSSTNTLKRIAGSGVDRKLKPAAVASTAVATRVVSSSVDSAPRSSSRSGARKTMGHENKALPATHNAEIRRLRPVVGVPSVVARFGAPTAASSGKDRRREGLVNNEVRSGAIPRDDCALLRGGTGGRPPRRPRPSAGSGNALSACNLLPVNSIRHLRGGKDRQQQHAVHSRRNNGTATRSRRSRPRTAAAKRVQPPPAVAESASCPR